MTKKKKHHGNKGNKGGNHRGGGQNKNNDHGKNNAAEKPPGFMVGSKLQDDENKGTFGVKNPQNNNDGNSKNANNSRRNGGSGVIRSGNDTKAAGESGAPGMLPLVPIPKGLRNLGSTCYFNAMIQCVGAGTQPYLLQLLMALSQWRSITIDEPFRVRVPSVSVKDKKGANKTKGGQQKKNSPNTSKTAQSSSGEQKENLEEQNKGEKTSRVLSVPVAEIPLSLDNNDDRRRQMPLYSALFAFAKGHQPYPDPLFNQIGRKVPRFRNPCIQQDAHELLRLFMEELRQEELDVARCALNNAPEFSGFDDREMRAIFNALQRRGVLRPALDAVFCGQLLQTVRCHECQHVSTNVEPFFDLSLSIVDKQMSPVAMNIVQPWTPKRKTEQQQQNAAEGAVKPKNSCSFGRHLLRKNSNPSEQKLENALSTGDNQENATKTEGATDEESKKGNNENGTEQIGTEKAVGGDGKAMPSNVTPQHGGDGGRERGRTRDRRGSSMRKKTPPPPQVAFEDLSSHQKKKLRREAKKKGGRKKHHDGSGQKKTAADETTPLQDLEHHQTVEAEEEDGNNKSEVEETGGAVTEAPNEQQIDLLTTEETEKNVMGTEEKDDAYTFQILEYRRQQRRRRDQFPPRPTTIFSPDDSIFPSPLPPDSVADDAFYEESMTANQTTMDFYDGMGDAELEQLLAKMEQEREKEENEEDQRGENDHQQQFSPTHQHHFPIGGGTTPPPSPPPSSPTAAGLFNLLIKSPFVQQPWATSSSSSSDGNFIKRFFSTKQQSVPYSDLLRAPPPSPPTTTTFSPGNDNDGRQKDEKDEDEEEVVDETLLAPPPEEEKSEEKRVEVENAKGKDEVFGEILTFGVQEDKLHGQASLSRNNGENDDGKAADLAKGFALYDDMMSKFGASERMTPELKQFFKHFSQQQMMEVVAKICGDTSERRHHPPPEEEQQKEGDNNEWGNDQEKEDTAKKSSLASPPSPDENAGKTENDEPVTETVLAAEKGANDGGENEQQPDGEQRPDPIHAPTPDSGLPSSQTSSNHGDESIEEAMEASESFGVFADNKEDKIKEGNGEEESTANQQNTTDNVKGGEETAVENGGPSADDSVVSSSTASAGEDDEEENSSEGGDGDQEEDGEKEPEIPESVLAQLTRPLMTPSTTTEGNSPAMLDFLKAFIDEETLAGYRCGRCCKQPETGDNTVKKDEGKKQSASKTSTKTVSATKRSLVFRPPVILTVHLKRFEHHQCPRTHRVRTTKINTHVQFPFSFNLAPFCNGLVQRVKTAPSSSKKVPMVLYSLYGVVQHFGSLGGGHYIAFVRARRYDEPRISALLNEARRDTGGGTGVHALAALFQRLQLEEGEKETPETCATSSEGVLLQGPPHPPSVWYRCDDYRVSAVGEEEVRRAQAYLLFYERIK